MYKKPLILLFISTFFLITINSCSKDKNNNPETQCNDVKELLNYDILNIPSPGKEYIYDKTGRIIHIKGQNQNETFFKYSKTTIEQNITYFQGASKKKLTLYLDNKGRITKTSEFNYDYKYNSEGYLISFNDPFIYMGELIRYTTYYFTYEKGNLIRISSTDNNSFHGTTNFSYFDAAAKSCMGYNSPLALLGMVNIFWDHQILVEKGFFGKNSKNLLKSVNFSRGNREWPQEYQFDAKGRIVRYENYGFKYQCD